MKLILTPPSPAQEIMDQDVALLERAEKTGESFLHLYEWLPNAATYGYFVNPATVFDPQVSLDLGKRPTGGGVLFHTHDYAFSLILANHHPLYSANTLESYRQIHQMLKELLTPFLKKRPAELTTDAPCNSNARQRFCMAEPTRYDLLLEGKKLAGAAERRKKNALLHQTTISLCPPDFAFLEKALVNGKETIESMRRWSAYLGDQSDLPSLRKELQETLCKIL